MCPTSESAALALGAGADGVHLAGTPLPGAAGSVRNAFRSASPIISVPCHSLEDIDVACGEQVDLILFSPVFEKLAVGFSQPAQGLEGLRLACAAARGTPVLALGGVTIGNAFGLPSGRRCWNCRHSTLRGRRLAEALEANRADGTIYSGIRLNHAECQFEKVPNPPSIGSKPAVSLLLKRATGGSRHAPLGCRRSCTGHANHADGDPSPKRNSMLAWPAFTR